MAFDWLRFLDSYGIEYRLGPAENIRRNHVGINCPRCPRDGKFHFGIDLDTGRIRGCWRDDSHWLSPAALLCSLIPISFNEAKRMLSEQEMLSSGVTPEDLLAQLHQSEAPLVQPFQPLQMPPSFQKFHLQPMFKERRFHKYLQNRGFSQPGRVGRSYGLRWCSEGEFRGRIIFPIWVDGRLVGWTARALGWAQPRYMATPPGDGMQRLLWESRTIQQKDVLVVVEGPFDALKVSYAVDDVAVAVALLTNTAGPSKLERILKLSKKAARVILFLDEGAETQALQLERELSIIAPEVIFCPPGSEDPGKMTVEQIKRILFDADI